MASVTDDADTHPNHAAASVLHTPELLEECLSYISMPDLATVAQTSHHLGSSAREAARVRWNDTLRKWVRDPNGLRSIMRRTGSIVSGSAALAYAMSRTPWMARWMPQDLDIYCPLTAGEAIIQYLVDSEEYEVKVPNTLDAGTNSFMEYHGGISAVVHLNRGTLSVDVICSSTPSPTFPLPSFWGTLVVNYVTADQLVVVYPRLTFEGMGCVNPVRAGQLASAYVVMKYHQRGFVIRLFDQFNTRCRPGLGEENMLCPHTMRRFVDGGCFVMPFSRQVDQAPGLGQLTTFWRYGGPPCGGSCMRDTTNRIGLDIV
ncbi:hypothetical protein OF83DRAFT_57882 [Amylostereum chailletii]|nr:hypothetical protein OF83DRAFT_57882 [Amylostereum chailletii]